MNLEEYFETLTTLDQVDSIFGMIRPQRMFLKSFIHSLYNNFIVPKPLITISKFERTVSFKWRNKTEDGQNTCVATISIDSIPRDFEVNRGDVYDIPLVVSIGDQIYNFHNCRFWTPYYPTYTNLVPWDIS